MDALELIKAERDRQDAKWGVDRRLPITLWFTILSEEVGEVARAILERDYANLVEELTQVAAVAQAALEDVITQTEIEYRSTTVG